MKQNVVSPHKGMVWGNRGRIVSGRWNGGEQDSRQIGRVYGNSNREGNIMLLHNWNATTVSSRPNSI